jgi:tetratricopeptide (TPR) repeat protein
MLGCASGQVRRDLAVEYYNLGNAHYRIGNLEKAIELFNRSIDFDPSILSSHSNLSLALIRQGKAAEARDLLRRLLDQEPENTSLLQILSYSYYIMNDTHEALETFDRILRLIPLDPWSLYNRGLVLWKSEQLEEAAKSFEELLLLGSELKGDLYQDALFNLGEIYLQQQRAEEAVGYLERYLEWQPEDNEGLLLLGQGYRELALYSDAMDVYDLMLAMDETQAEVWMAKAEILLTRIEDEVRGIDALTRALDLGFTDAERLDSLVKDQRNIAGARVEEILDARDLLP